MVIRRLTYHLDERESDLPVGIATSGVDPDQSAVGINGPLMIALARQQLALVVQPVLRPLLAQLQRPAHARTTTPVQKQRSGTPTQHARSML
jgi:hypothetical protein